MPTYSELHEQFLNKLAQERTRYAQLGHPVETPGKLGLTETPALFYPVIARYFALLEAIKEEIIFDETGELVQYVTDRVAKIPQHFRLSPFAKRTGLAEVTLFGTDVAQFLAVVDAFPFTITAVAEPVTNQQSRTYLATRTRIGE